jgi:nucleoside-diphosphate-sugar epimerase
MKALIVGCGYVGIATARLLLASGYEVHGVRRSQAGRDALAVAGIRPLHGDVSDAASIASWPRDWDVVVNAASSAGGGVDAYRAVYLQGTQNLIEHLGRAAVRSFVHVGSTSVYAQVDGSWVDEGSPTEPRSEAARVLVATEQALRDAWERRGFPAIVLRASGIYGPERGHARQELLHGRARIDGDGSRWLNMVHRDDVAGAIVAAAAGGRPGRTYNVTDNEPVRQRDLLAWLATRLGCPMPGPREDANPRPSTRAPTNKRVSNRRLRDDLGWTPRFPSYREGYAEACPVPDSTPDIGPG